MIRPSGYGVGLAVAVALGVGLAGAVALASVGVAPDGMVGLAGMVGVEGNTFASPGVFAPLRCQVPSAARLKLRSSWLLV